MTSYNATVAKIKAIYGKRLREEDYNNMLSLQSVSEIAEYLRTNTYFADVLSPVDTNTIHRGLLENILNRSVFQNYIKILKFEHLGNTEFYNFKIVLYEIEEILRCISFINAKSTEQIEKAPVYLRSYSTINFVELSKVRTFEDLLIFLKGTPYYTVLSKYMAENNNVVNYTQIEVVLRTYYINRLFSSIDKEFNPNEKKSIYNLVNTDIDLINIINSYRLKTYYSEDYKSIKEKMLPFYGKFRANQQIELYSADDETDFMSKYAKTYYGRQMVEAGLDLTNLEQAVLSLRYKYAKRALIQSSDAPVSIYAFMLLLETEIRNIIKIIEGVRYNVSSKEIETLLVI